MQIRGGPVACDIDSITAYFEVFYVERLCDVADKLQESRLKVYS